MILDWIAQLLPGLLVSLQVTGTALLIGLPLGMLVGIAVEHGPRALSILLTVVVEIGRGLPALVLLYLVYFGLPDLGILLDAFWSVVAAFAYTTAAYTSEIFRGALRGVARGQYEAAEALGIPVWDRYALIIIPQAMRLAGPAIMGFAILVFQGSSLAYAVALPEMLSRAYSIGTITFQYLGVLTLAGVVYAVITIGAGVLVGLLAKRLGSGRPLHVRRTTPVPPDIRKALP